MPVIDASTSDKSDISWAQDYADAVKSGRRDDVVAIKQAFGNCIWRWERVSYLAGPLIRDKMDKVPAGAHMEFAISALSGGEVVTVSLAGSRYTGSVGRVEPDWFLLCTTGYGRMIVPFSKVDFIQVDSPCL